MKLTIQLILLTLIATSCGSTDSYFYCPKENFEQRVADCKKGSEYIYLPFFNNNFTITGLKINGVECPDTLIKYNCLMATLKFSTISGCNMITSGIETYKYCLDFSKPRLTLKFEKKNGRNSYLSVTSTNENPYLLNTVSVDSSLKEIFFFGQTVVQISESALKYNKNNSSYNFSLQK